MLCNKCFSNDPALMLQTAFCKAHSYVQRVSSSKSAQVDSFLKFAAILDCLLFVDALSIFVFLGMELMSTPIFPQSSFHMPIGIEPVLHKV